MSSAPNIVVDFYGPVLLAAALTTLGFIYREVRLNRKEQRSRLDKLVLDVHTLTQNDSAIDGRLNSIGVRLDKYEIQYNREIPALHENVAILAAEFEKHEQWHERN